ncbi:MAG: FAD-binding oxidoreductase [Gammaproteobacteria bacterium]|nr:FAD-binding oxidoreductase [Gammaproteobacteria bacterium]
MDRRRFLKLSTASGLSSLYGPLTLATETSSTTDVTFLKPADPDYANYRGVFNKRIVKTPAVIAACQNEAGVIHAIQYAVAAGLPVTIKSGAHSFEGYSLNDGGLVIDLSALQQHELNPDNTFIAGPACRLMQMYEYLIPQGRLLPAGSCGMVGIAGLTLGGGYGLFSRAHGLACDFLQAARLVDAKGNVHAITPGSELLWACRGSGNGHFGVVTQLQFTTIAAMPKLWSYRFKSSALSVDKLVQLAEHWFDLCAQLPRECFSAFVLNNKSLAILITSTLQTPSAALRRNLATLETLMQKRQPDKHADLQPSLRRYYGVLTPLYFKNASAGFYRGFADIRAVVKQIFTLTQQTKGMLFQINTLGGAIADTQFRAASSYAHRDFPFLAEVQTYWDHPQQEAACVAAVRRTQALLQENGVRAHYVNYPDGEFSDWAQAYYGVENYPRLQRLKKQLDPTNLFQYPQSIRLDK